MNQSDTIRCVLERKGRGIHSVTPRTTVFDALELMAREDIGALPVIDDAGQLWGVFSERDYARKVALHGRSSRELTVDAIMTPEVVTSTPEHTVEECMQLMTTYRCRHLPVLEDGRVAAMVSIGDLVKYVISMQEQEIKHLHAYIAGGYGS